MTKKITKWFGSYLSIKDFLLFFIPFLLFFILALFILKHIVYTTIFDHETSFSSIKTAPRTILPLLLDDDDTGTNTRKFDIKNFAGHIVLLNFWGSWCQPCQDEHSLLMHLANSSLFDLISINYKDSFTNSKRFLNVHGNPFRAIGYDPQGRAAIDWGIYGLPETFLINREGIILYHHLGPLTPQIMQEKILPLIHKDLN